MEAKLVYQLKQSGAETLAQQSQEDEPSYEDTVNYIQERLDSQFETRTNCIFQDREPSVGGSHLTNIIASKLSPHVSWSQEYRFRGSISCSGAANCVEEGGVSTLYGSVTMGSSSSYWDFRIKTDTDKAKMEKALLHLLDLCGVRPEKPDMF